MILHGVLPNDMDVSTLVPIPKNSLKSLMNSENYRAIALSSICGKILDQIILQKNIDILQTSHLQFGFKKQHSTTHCTFVLQEVVE